MTAHRTRCHGRVAAAGTYVVDTVTVIDILDRRQFLHTEFLSGLRTRWIAYLIAAERGPSAWPLTKACAHLAAGASIIDTSSVSYDQRKLTLLLCATTKGAIANFAAGLA